MRKWIFIFVTFTFFSAERPPKLAKHYQGVYAGVAQRPAININGSTQNIAKTTISLTVTDKDMQMHIGEAFFSSSYTIGAVTKTYTVLTANFEAPLGVNTFAVYKKGKKITWQQASVEEEVVLLKE